MMQHGFVPCAMPLMDCHGTVISGWPARGSRLQSWPPRRIAGKTETNRIHCLGPNPAWPRGAPRASRRPRFFPHGKRQACLYARPRQFAGERAAAPGRTVRQFLPWKGEELTHRLPAGGALGAGIAASTPELMRDLMRPGGWKSPKPLESLECGPSRPQRIDARIDAPIDAPPAAPIDASDAFQANWLSLGCIGRGRTGGKAAMPVISTRQAGSASRASTVARAGLCRGSSQASQARFTAAKSAMSAR